MKTLRAISSLLILSTSAAVAQEIHPLWVQHHNGLVNVEASNKLPILVKAGATGDEAYIAGGHGKVEGFVNFLRYDDDHYLLGINENGIDEATETDPAKLDAATKCPDRSLVWIDAHTGKYLGLAIKVAIDEVPLAAQSANPFWWKIAVDEGPYGQKAVYSGFKYKLLRYAPTGTVPDANFPAGRPTWDPNLTVAWVEPVPDEPDPSRPPLDKFVQAIHYNFNDSGVDPARQPGLPAPVSADDPNWVSYVGSSSGDGSASFRVKALRVSGGGLNTVVWFGGATWRASTHEQEFATDDGVNFYPIARLNDRGDCWGAKGCYSLGGMPSSIRTAPDGRKWCIQGHYPGSGWGARPGRYTKDPAALDDIGRDPNVDPPTDANDAGPNHKSRPHYYDPDNRALGGLPAFAWESAGTGGSCGPNTKTDGVTHYDGNWVLTADTKDGVDYIVSYAIPSWDQQFGRVGPDWPNSVDPTSTFKPGWVGIHTLDGKIAPGQNNAWKLPAYETDEPIVDPSGNAGTGFDYGYNGDVTVYPDATAPAGSGKALVLVSFGQYGFGVFVVSNVPPSGTLVSPSNVSTDENHPVVLSGEFIGQGSPLFYRWQKSTGGAFADIPGASGNLAKFGRNSETVSLTIPVAQTSDSGQYRFIVSNPAGTLTSQAATVTVSSDRTPPTVLSASSVDGGSVDICFNELLDAGNPDDPVADPGSARTLANYVISGGAVAQSATLQPDGKSVRLDGVTGLGQTFTVTVTGVRDRTRNNPIPAPGQTVSGSIQGFINVDIGDTTEPGSTFACAPGTFDIWAGGGDFWGTADSGRFTYQERNGNFDVRVQIAANERPSNRNGIMVRESVDPGSPMVHITWNPDVYYGSHARLIGGGPVDWFSPERNWVCDHQNAPPNVWLRLQRTGDDFTAYYGADGLNWNFAGTTTLALANPVLLGLASNRGGGTGLGHTTFANYGDLKALQIKVEAGVTVLSWSGTGVLEAAPAITGPWSSAGLSQNNPQNVTTTGAQQFFRLR